jgi:hypothetical protein
LFRRPAEIQLHIGEEKAKITPWHSWALLVWPQ